MSEHRGDPRLGVLTVSDRAARGEYEDRGGPAVQAYFDSVVRPPFDVCARVVSDDRSLIEEALVQLIDRDGCCLVVTTGGTGPAPRDVTPEATLAVCDREMPGFGELMRQVSLAKVATAILSRQTAAVRDRTADGAAGAGLVVNLPGAPKAIAECLDAVFPAIPYCIDLIGGPYLETDGERVVAFRPASARRPEPAEG